MILVLGTEIGTRSYNRLFQEVWVREVKEAIATYFQKTIENQRQVCKYVCKVYCAYFHCVPGLIF